MVDASAPTLPAGVTKAIRLLAFRAGSGFIRFGYSCQDLEQELILHYLRHHHQHDSNRASPATFAARICRHRLFNMFAAETASKRTVSGGLAPLSDTVPALDAGDQMTLRIDVGRVVAKLPAEVAAVAKLISHGASVAEAAATLNISRSTVYRCLIRLRRQFSDAGLCGYLVRRGCM